MDTMPIVLPGHILIHVLGPVNKYGQRPFTMYWYADYIPGHPDPNAHTRGQVFLTDLVEMVRSQESKGMIVTVEDKRSTK